MQRMIWTYSESLTTSSGIVTLEAGRILLERVAACSVTRGGGIDTNGRAGTTLITDCID